MKLSLPSRKILTGALLAALLPLAACGDSAPPAASPATPVEKAPAAPLFQKKEIADWCPEHGVPESICTRCNAHLIAGFKQKGDWCKEHDLPESQCLACHPELRAKFQAMAPKDKR